MGMSRSEKRACRREAFLRSAQATVTQAGGPKKRRASRTRVQLRKILLATSFVAAFAVVYAARPNRAMADLPTGPAPEIDPSSMAGAMTLLVGGVLTLTGRSRRV